jgi:hypothetical protein
MKIDERMLELLYRSFDDDLSASEKAELDAALAESEDLRRENAKIAGMRKAIASSGAEGFGYMFAERVMRRIEAERAGAFERAGSAERAGSTERAGSVELAGRPAAEKETAPSLFESLLRAFRPVAMAGAVAVLALMVYNIVDSRDVSLSAALGLQETTLEEALDSPLASVLEELS